MSNIEPDASGRSMVWLHRLCNHVFGTLGGNNLSGRECSWHHATGDRPITKDRKLSRGFSPSLVTRVRRTELLSDLLALISKSTTRTWSTCTNGSVRGISLA